MSSPRLTAQFGQYYASVPSTGSSPFSSSPSSSSPAFGSSPLLSSSPALGGPSSRRVSIRPPNLAGLATTGPGALLRLRGRWRKTLAVVVLVLATSGIVFLVADSSSLGHGRGAARFMPAGGFGRDVMGREDDASGDDPNGVALELSPIEVKGDHSRLCLLFPWRDECDGVSGGKSGVKRSPFDGLRFSERFGHLFYPAYRAQPRPGAKPQPPADVENQPHAIHYLVQRARREWDAKVARQSKTLEQAVDEYERRYKRRPPQGFDKWFEYAQKHKFVMVDEFDAMMDRVQLYLAVRPSTMVARHDKIQFDDDFWITDKTFTIEVKRQGKHLAAHGPMKRANERPDQMLKLLRGIAKLLPDMNVTFTGHDVPWGTMSGESKEVHRKAAREGVLLTDEEADDYRDDWKWDGWARICPPDSPLRNVPSYDERMASGDVYAPPRTRSFIKDHVPAMDLCNHPENQLIHGFTAWPGPRPGLIYPLFVSTMTSLHTDFLIPPVDQYDYALGIDPAWEDKKHNKLVWRGSTTGANLNIEHFRKWSQRPRLCRLPFAKGKVTVPYAPDDTATDLGPVKELTGRNKALALRYFDFEFLDRPRQCDDPAVCDAFEKEFNWSGWMGPDEQNEYKYMLDVDGNGWSGRFHRLMSTNSLVLKSTIFPEWYQDMIQPWVHYVPVQTDYSDLYPIMAFFLGDEHGQGGHDALAKEIATAGKKWAETHWRWVDMEIFMFRLLLEYNRIMNRDDANPTSMDM